MSLQSLKRELFSCVEMYHEKALSSVRASSSVFECCEKASYLEVLRFAAKHTKALIKQRVLCGSDGREAMSAFISLLNKHREQVLAYRLWYLHELVRMHGAQLIPVLYPM